MVVGRGLWCWGLGGVVGWVGVGGVVVELGGVGVGGVGGGRHGGGDCGYRRKRSSRGVRRRCLCST